MEIDGKHYTWTNPVCERCWFDTEGWGWPETGGDESRQVRLPMRMVDPQLAELRAAAANLMASWQGNLTEAVQRLREAYNLTAEPEVEKCCKCGGATIAGIFVRVDPRTVAHPREEAVA